MTANTNRRNRGTIKRHGQQYEVRVYSGLDPATGKRLYLYGNAPDEKTAKRVLSKLISQVDEGRAIKRRATVSQAVDAWLRVAEIDASTRNGYTGYIERTIKPRIGSLDLSKVNVKRLEDF